MQTIARAQPTFSLPLRPWLTILILPVSVKSILTVRLEDISKYSCILVREGNFFGHSRACSMPIMTIGNN